MFIATHVHRAAISLSLGPLPLVPPQQGRDAFAMSKWRRWRGNHWIFSCLLSSPEAQGSSWWLRQTGNSLRMQAPCFPHPHLPAEGSVASCRGRHKMKARDPGQQYKGGHIQISRGYLGRELLPSLHSVTQPASSSSSSHCLSGWCWTDNAVAFGSWLEVPESQHSFPSFLLCKGKMK